MITIGWLQGQIETLTERKDEAERRMVQARKAATAANREYKEALSILNDLDGLVRGLKDELAYQESKAAKKMTLCATCADEIDEGYGECEGCGKFFCSEHNSLENGKCDECRSDGVPF